MSSKNQSTVFHTIFIVFCKSFKFILHVSVAFYKLNNSKSLLWSKGAKYSRRVVFVTDELHTYGKSF